MTISDVDVVVRTVSRIVEAYRARSARDEESGLEVTDKQARILRQLDDRDPTMVGELAEFLGVTASTMSLNLKRLDEMGCVTRARDPDDRRVMNVRLTDRGRRLRDGASLLDRVRVDSALGTLRPEERTRVLEGLALLAEAAERSEARADRYLDALTR
jgi:DNA-binding MarR family transcriptional regulator